MLVDSFSWPFHPGALVSTWIKVLGPQNHGQVLQHLFFSCGHLQRCVQTLQRRLKENFSCLLKLHYMVFVGTRYLLHPSLCNALGGCVHLHCLEALRSASIFVFSSACGSLLSILDSSAMIFNIFKMHLDLSASIRHTSFISAWFWFFPSGSTCPWVHQT